MKGDDVRNFYSCFVCQKYFENDKEINDFALCSKRCELKFLYNVLQKYPNRNLKIIWFCNYPEIALPKTRSEGLFHLSNFYVNKKILSGGLS